MEMKEHLNTIVNESKEYFQIRTELIQLQIKKTTAKLLAQSSSGLLTILIAMLLLVFGSLSAAFYLADYYQSLYKGFAFVSVFYFALLLLFILFSKKIKKHFTNLFISVLFNSGNND